MGLAHNRRSVRVQTFTGMIAGSPLKHQKQKEAENRVVAPHGDVGLQRRKVWGRGGRLVIPQPQGSGDSSATRPRDRNRGAGAIFTYLSGIFQLKRYPSVSRCLFSPVWAVESFLQHNFP